MTFHCAAIVPAALAAVLALASTPLAAISIIANGAAHADVVLAASASEDELFAAEELVRYVGRATGVRLTVRPTARVGRPAILIGLSAVPDDVRARIRQLRGDAYVIDAGRMPLYQITNQERMTVGDGDAVILAGNGAQGTSFAVYEFLERYAGVRWLWPGDVGEVVPASRDIAVEHGSLTREPAFLWRHLGPGGTLWGPADRWQKQRELGISFAHQAAMRLWERRNRFGGESIYGGHAFGEILPPPIHGPEHPEYYALVNGKRDWENFNGKHRGQLCTSNPDVVQKVIEYCREQFDLRPELDGVSIAANDGRGFCECDTCLRLDTGRMQSEDADPEQGRAAQTRIITDRMVTFGNLVAEGVARTHPGKKVLFFAYSQFHEPPERVRAHPNLLIAYTVQASAFWNMPAREKAFREFAGWARMAPTFGVYEYHTQTNFPDMPRLFPDLIQVELKELLRLGSRYFHTQAGNGFSTNGLNFYVLGRLLWDPDQDVAKIQADYVKSAFGPAAPAMSRYYDRFIRSWREQKVPSPRMNAATLSDYRAVLGMYPKSLREAARRDLEEARRLADGEHRRRVEFVHDGYRYFEMTIEAAEATLPLLEAGWRFTPSVQPPANPDRQQFDKAIALWRARDRYIEEHREDFVLSYMWIKSGDATRSFNPLRAVDREARR